MSMSIVSDIFDVAEKKYGFDRAIEILCYVSNVSNATKIQKNTNVSMNKDLLVDGKKEYRQNMTSKGRK